MLRKIAHGPVLLLAADALQSTGHKDWRICGGGDRGLQTRDVLPGKSRLHAGTLMSLINYFVPRLVSSRFNVSLVFHVKGAPLCMYAGHRVEYLELAVFI